MTLPDDRVTRPGSLASNMYDIAMITCTNIEWTKEFYVDQIINHKFHDCPFRVVKCPANKCLYKDTPNSVHNNALECPFLTFYCSTCDDKYGAEVLTHSCTKRLQRQLAELIHSPFGSLPTIPNLRTGDVILPSKTSLWLDVRKTHPRYPTRWNVASLRQIKDTRWG